MRILYNNKNRWQHLILTGGLVIWTTFGAASTLFSKGDSILSGIGAILGLPGFILGTLGSAFLSGNFHDYSATLVIIISTLTNLVFYFYLLGTVLRTITIDRSSSPN